MYLHLAYRYASEAPSRARGPPGSKAARRLREPRARPRRWSRAQPHQAEGPTPTPPPPAPILSAKRGLQAEVRMSAEESLTKTSSSVNSKGCVFYGEQAAKPCLGDALYKKKLKTVDFFFMSSI